MHLKNGDADSSYMKALSANRLLESMKEGVVYRRAELARFSRAVDRDLRTLIAHGEVVKPATGLYFRPQLSRWGKLPAEARALVRAYLKTDDFLLSTPTNFNTLGVGFTQVYNLTTVYNKKRHGKAKLGNQSFDFKRVANYPRQLSPEFLFVDLVNNLSQLAEHPDNLQEKVRKRLMLFDSKVIKRYLRKYAKESTLKYFSELQAV